MYRALLVHFAIFLPNQAMIDTFAIINVLRWN